MARFQILYHSRRIQTAIEDRLATRPEDFAKPLAYNRVGLWSLQIP